VTDDPDIKGLLGRALGDHEPPLRIDRDEVFRVGRKRLRRRRVFEAGGAVAAVVVAVVGASLLTGMVGDDPDDDRIPPAASSTQSAPPGPGLPLTESPTSTATNGGPPSAPVSLSPAFTSAHAAELTQALYTSAAIYNKTTVPSTPKFVVRGSSYRFDADIIGPTSEGALQITVEAQLDNDVPVNCGDMPRGNCAVTFDNQTGVAVSHWTEGKVARIVARAILPDGSRITALSTNHSARQVNAGEPPINLAPPIYETDLVNMVLRSGLRVT
jgi:hypothetical protein